MQPRESHPSYAEKGKLCGTTSGKPEEDETEDRGERRKYDQRLHDERTYLEESHHDLLSLFVRRERAE